MTASAASHPRSAASASGGSGPRRRSRSAAVALVAALALATAACSSDSDATPSATVPPATPTTATTAPTTTTTTEPPSPEDEVEQAYLEANAVFFEIAEEPNADDPRLAATRTDPNLSLVQETFRKAAAASLIGKFPEGVVPIPSLSDLKVEGTTATFVSCLVDNGQQVRTRDQVVVNDQVESRLSQVEMQLIEGAWLVRSQENTMTWPDGKGCDR